MPTPDWTTIKAALEELVTRLRTNLTSDPPTPTQPFRRVVLGACAPQDQPRPFLSLRPARARPGGVADNDKLLEIEVELGVVTDVVTSDPHGPLLDAAAAVDDYLDGVLDSGILEGAEGFDDREWTFDAPRQTAGARVASATAALSFVVKVQRSHNRAAAS